MIVGLACFSVDNQTMGIMWICFSEAWLLADFIGDKLQ